MFIFSFNVFELIKNFTNLLQLDKNYYLLFIFIETLLYLFFYFFKYYCYFLTLKFLLSFLIHFVLFNSLLNIKYFLFFLYYFNIFFKKHNFNCFLLNLISMIPNSNHKLFVKIFFKIWKMNPLKNYVYLHNWFNSK
jgi:hypothetical protein